jgi:tetratricopeptide (TPR) repeat protein
MRSRSYPFAKHVKQRPALILPDMLRMALAHHQAGRLNESEQIYRQILAIDARHADSLHLLGMVAYQAGRHEIAVDRIVEAILIDGSIASYHSNLGTVLQAQGRLDEAAACYECALVLKPDLAEAYLNLGNVRQPQGRLDEAMVCYQRTLALKPNLAEAHYNMGNALHSLDRLHEAVACYERALELQPNYAKAHHNLGCALRAMGMPDEALLRYRKALDLQPDYSQAHFSVALAQLFDGDFAAGWRNYEARWRSDDHKPMRAYRQPLWAGETLASGRLLIWGEQGVGDEIMFAGLMPEVIRTDNHCVLDCDPRLQPLFARSFPAVDVVSGWTPEHASELNISAHLPSGSLPGLFRRSGLDFSAVTSPYLIADQVERERFRARYADGRRLVGLAWSTNNRKIGRNRSIDLTLLSPLFARSDIQWVSLQYGNHDALEAQAAAASAPVLIDRAVDQLSDIDRFAAQVAAMDLVITIDNSTAHLAGALGVPVWVLLPFAPDWRWLRHRDDSPWYPPMRLFRQPKLGDWEAVVREVLGSLHATGVS